MENYYAVVDFTNKEELDKFINLSKMTEEEMEKFNNENIKLLIFNTVNGNVIMYINHNGDVYSKNGNYERLLNIMTEKKEKK